MGGFRSWGALLQAAALNFYSDMAYLIHEVMLQVGFQVLRKLTLTSRWKHREFTGEKVTSFGGREGRSIR